MRRTRGQHIVAEESEAQPRARGWTVLYLGSDTPIEALTDAARFANPSLVVVSAVAADRLRAIEPELRSLAKRQRLASGS